MGGRALVLDILGGQAVSTTITLTPVVEADLSGTGAARHSYGDAEALMGDTCGYGITQSFAGTALAVPPNAPVGMGAQLLRIGWDRPCSVVDTYRAVMLFHTAAALDAQFPGQTPAQLKAAFTSATLTVSLVRPAGHPPGIGAVVAAWVLPTNGIGGDSLGTYFTPQTATGGVGWQSGPVIGPATPAGPVVIDLSAAFYGNLGQPAIVGRPNIGQGRTFVVRLQLQDDTTVPATPNNKWFAVGSAESATLYQPKLQLVFGGTGVGAGTTAPVVLDGAASLLEPTCVILEGSVLLHDHSLQDTVYEASHGIRALRQGNEVVIDVELTDHWTRPSRHFDLAAGETLLGTLTAIDGTVVLADAPLTRVDRGVYRLRYVTQITDPVGLYRLSVVYAGQGAS